MAKAKRANHRSGTDRPRWTPGGAAGEARPDGTDWEADAESVGQNGSGPPHALNGRQQQFDSDAAPGEFTTSVRLDEIAIAAMALSDGLRAATRGLPESVESRRLRRELDDAAGRFRAVAGELEITAGDLVRLAASEGQSCGITWGVCPEHGISLMDLGEVIRCRVLGCHREQAGGAAPCPQPVAYRVVDAAGPALLTCTGHAIACRLHLVGAVITLASDPFELL
ncbi:MAG TPA: hypothetical protein VFT31_11060 [Kribbella sp.]|nr:hypothetical protein [Kribbella sp.]